MNKKINKNDKKFSALMLLSYLWYHKIVKPKNQTLTKFDNYCVKKSIQFFDYLKRFVKINERDLLKQKLSLLKADILIGLPEKDRPTAAVIMDTIIAHQITESDYYDSSEFVNTLKIGVDAYLGGLARHIASIQPMQGPVGIAYSLQYKSNEDHQACLEVGPITMTASTRQLNAGWSIEAVRDVMVGHNIDIKDEIEAAITADVSSEVDAYVIDKLLKNVGTVATITIDSSKEVDTSGVISTIRQVANEIARKTRRGTGNFIVVSPLLASILQTASTKFKPATAADYSTHIRVVNGNKFVGTIGTIKVFCSLSIAEGSILVGYKGTSEYDAGYILGPYVAIARSHMVINPNTFQPLVHLKTRYGESFVDGKIVKGSDYYGVVLVDIK